MAHNSLGERVSTVSFGDSVYKAADTRTLLLAGLATFVLVGCGGHEVYREEAFEKDSPYYRRFSLSAENACEGARRALLSQGYVVDDTPMDHLKGVKQFQPDEDIHIVVEFNVVCMDENGSSMMFANAIQIQYDLKKSRDSVGLSVKPLGSIRLPSWSSTTESLVKAGSETIDSEEFYERFFKLTRQMLDPTDARLSEEEALMEDKVMSPLERLNSP